MFRKFSARTDARRRRSLSRDLPPHLMRDIGLEPWPEPPVIIHSLW